MNQSKMETRLKFRKLFLIVLAVFVFCPTILSCTKSTKGFINYDGKYATDKVVYSYEHGYCLLITYYPNYRYGNAKGFAVTHIPLKAGFTRLMINGDDAADSKDLFEAYRLIATLGDNDLVNMLVKMLYDSEATTKSYDIGNNGRYFVIPYSKP